MASVIVDIEFRKNGKILQALKILPAMNNIILQQFKTWTKQENTSLSVKALALKNDIYGNAYEIDDKSYVLLNSCSDVPVFLEKDLELEDSGYLGEINRDFLCWTKTIAKEHANLITICYEHERGDYLYEEAIWKFDYSKSSKIVEEFSLCYYEGREEPLWCKKITRSREGDVRIES